jgi:adenosylhomocysteine nucleosidase
MIYLLKVSEMMASRNAAPVWFRDFADSLPRISTPPRPARKAPAASHPHILAITGLRREASIASASRVIAIAHGGHQPSLRKGLAAAIGPHTRGLISFGVAGGIDPSVKRGATIIADEVIGAGDEPVVTPREKAELLARTGARIVDNESAATAEFAAAHGLPFVVLRVVLDDADTALPPAALVALTKTGGTNFARIAASMLKNPRQHPALIRCGRDAAAAFAELGRQRLRLGHDFGHADRCDFALAPA